MLRESTQCVHTQWCGPVSGSVGGPVGETWALLLPPLVPVLVLGSMPFPALAPPLLLPPSKAPVLLPLFPPVFTALLPPTLLVLLPALKLGAAEPLRGGSSVLSHVPAKAQSRRFGGRFSTSGASKAEATVSGFRMRMSMKCRVCEVRTRVMVGSVGPSGGWICVSEMRGPGGSRKLVRGVLGPCVGEQGRYGLVNGGNGFEFLRFRGGNGERLPSGYDVLC